MVRTIMIVDDDQAEAETIAIALQREGYETLVAYSGVQALDLARQKHPDLFVLDSKMPGMDGIELCRRLRADPAFKTTPVLFLIAKDAIGDWGRGFEVGANDSLTKPFDLRELALRIRTLLRHEYWVSTEAEWRQIQVGDLVLDSESHQLRTPDRKVLLTLQEFHLVKVLMRNAGKVHSADQLLQKVWDYPPDTGMPDLVRVRIKNIREKIEPNPREPMYLVCVLLRGYMIKSPDQDLGSRSTTKTVSQTPE